MIVRWHFEGLRGGECVCKHSAKPQGRLSWTPGVVLSFTQPAPSHTKLLFETSHSCVNGAASLHTLPTVLSSLTQALICQYALFILRDWQDELALLGEKKGWLKMKESQCDWRCFFFFAWNCGCLSLFFYHWNWSLSFTSLSGMFLFFKWLLASSSAAVCIWWNEHIKVFAVLTKQCALAAGLAGSYLLLQNTCWSDRLATKGPPAQESCQCCRSEWAGQWSREVAWTITHVPTRVQNAQKPESVWEHNRGNVGRKIEKEGERLTPASAWVLLSAVGIFTIYCIVA